VAPSQRIYVSAPDGVRLAVSLITPAGGGPWPALLEALPYRKDDMTASYEDSYRSFASSGYAVARVDVRGTGSSGGIAEDEYTLAERADLVAVIEWLASQEWCTGEVGMFGTSYGGFNSLQVAAERPPALKAIVPIFASDDRFADDVHYYGGALKQLDVIDYPTYMVAFNALPPVPSVWGEGWREEWDRRVEENEPWILTWLNHQRYDDTWRRGSAREYAERIEAATMIVAGWADGYTNIALRSFEDMTCPVRLLIGPWSHGDPETCVPGPNIDLTAEMVRWFDRWVKGSENGVDAEPPIVVFAQRSTRPDPLRREVRGRWRYEPTWPAARLAPQLLSLAAAEPGGMALGGGVVDDLVVQGDTGVTAWISCAGGLPWGQSSDQRADEAFSLTYTWPELDGELEILGHPRLHARVRSSAPVAFLSAKICDVFPDGESALVVRGMLNLTHRDSRERPSPLEPGVAYDVQVELEACSWTFEPGHRLRLDIAGTDWPNAWPPPGPVTLSIDRAASRLELPVLHGPEPVDEAPDLPPSPHPQSDPAAQSPEGWSRWEVRTDPISRERVALARYGGDGGPDGDAPGLRGDYGGEVGVCLTDPGKAWADGSADLEIRYPEATCGARTEVRVDSDDRAYRVRIELCTTENGEERKRRSWERTIPRDLQ
jgi:hypothetical protein